MQLFNWYYRQKVKYQELRAAFLAAQTAINNLSLDQDFTGMVRGGAVTQHDPTPDLTVDVSGQAAGYDDDAQRIAWSAVQRVNVAVDSNAVTTAVAGSGNEKWISLFVSFARAGSDPRVDGNSVPVDFQQDESFEFTVVQGAEAGAGMAARPNLQAGKLLLADIKRVFGGTTIVNAAISTTRRADQVVLEGTPLSIRSGFFKDALLDMLTALNSHITEAGFGHEATAIAVDDGPAWADATANGDDDLQAYLDNIVTLLAGTGGTAKLGGAVQTVGDFALSAATLADQLGQLLGFFRDTRRTRTITGNTTLDTPNFDTTINLDSTGGAFNLTLIAPATFKAGRRVRIVDVAGTLLANPVTLVRAGAESISGVAANKVLQTNFGAWWLESDGTNFFLTS